MSEDIGTAPAAAAPESAPDAGESFGTSSTSDIAARTIDRAESAGDEPGDGDIPASEPTETAVEATPTPGVMQPPLSEEEQLLADFGFKDAKKPDGREHYIPRSKVLKMIGSGLKRGQEKWAGERATLDGTVTDLRGRFETVVPVLKALDAGPEAFMAEAGRHDPRYAEFLKARSAPAATPAPVALPDPDFTLPDGSKTYTMKGIRESLVPFIVSQARAEAKAEAEALLKPVTERERATKEAEQATAADGARREAARSSMKEAESWPLFGPMAADGSLNEVQAAVLAEMKKDSDAAAAAGRRPTLSLEAAYIRVTSQRMSGGEQAMRAKLLKEMSAAASASPTVGRSGAEAVRAPAAHDTRSIAARTIDRLEGGA